jgi:hypothetical protein
MSKNIRKFRVHISETWYVEVRAMEYDIDNGVLKFKKEAGLFIGPSPFCLPVQVYKDVAIFKEWNYIEFVEVLDKAQ